ncbi:MAG: hypothetical protein FWE69_05750 [Clostridiales bacterium]|nr:hypothetical protein [Clostridiales bacterium]
MTTTLQGLENEYHKSFGEREILSADELIAFAVTLFNEIKTEGFSDESSNEDMLLFQYGVYDWGDENGKHFSFDITRQIFDPEEDEPYQLKCTLIFEPTAFMKIESYNDWSDLYDCVEGFVDHIKSTAGYEAASKMKAKKAELLFEQC